MEPIANETWKSFRRSQHRRRALILLSSLGEAYVGQLARGLGIRPDRTKQLLVGGKAYAHDLSLVGLGLARERLTSRGRAFEITAKGRRKARSMLASRQRRAEGRIEKEGADEGVSRQASAVVPTSVVSWSTEWRGAEYV